MAKETEVRMEIVIRTQGDKKNLKWSHILSTIGPTRIINCTTLSQRVIDLGVKANPERAEKQKLMNNYKRIIWSIIEGRYEIGSSLKESEIFIRFKGSNHNDRQHRLTFKATDGSLHVNSKVIFCLADPQSLDNLKIFIMFAMTIMQKVAIPRFISSSAALIGPSYGKHIYVELIGDKIKYIPLGYTTLIDNGFSVQTELHEKLSDDNLKVLDGICCTLHIDEHINERIAQMRTAGYIT
jgi:hypothetical protein